MVRESNPNWQDGKTEKHAKIRSSKEYAEWRLAVLWRDGFYCQMCFRNDFPLEVHHIKPFSKNLHLSTVHTNGITLCEICHATITGRENQYEQQFMECVNKNLLSIGKN
jgi:5-methylcytosine-specific restriction endonuclease McrA